MERVKITQYLKPNAVRMAFGFVIKVIGTIAELLLPLLLGYMLDDGENAPVRDVPSLLLFGGGMLALALVALYGNIIANRLASRVARDATLKVRGDLFSKTLSLSARQIDSCTLPTLVSRLSTDTYNLHNMLGMMQRLGVRVPIMLFGGLAFAFMLEPILTLILVAVLPVMLVVVLFIAGRGIRLYEALQRSNDAMVRKIRDDYAGIRVVKALSRTEYESASFHAVAGRVASDEMRAGIWTGASNPIVSLLLNLGMVAVVLVGALRVRDGVMSPAKIVAFVSYFTLILNAAMTVSRLFVTLAKGGASAKRICEILNLPQEPLLLPAAAGGAARVEFKDVTFSYGEGTAVEHVSFALKKGERLGVLGATGSGKSTLVQLLLRFYDANSGEILLDGQNVVSIPPDHSARKVRDRVPERFHHGGNGRGQRGFLPRHTQRSHRARPARGAGGLRVRAGAGPAIPPRRPRRQPFGRSETAHPHRPRLSGRARRAHLGRFFQRPRLPHGRRPARGDLARISRAHLYLHRPAHQFGAGLRQDPRPRKGQRGRTRHPRTAPGKLRNLSRHRPLARG